VARLLECLNENTRRDLFFETERNDDVGGNLFPNLRNALASLADVKFAEISPIVEINELLSEALDAFVQTPRGYNTMEYSMRRSHEQSLLALVRLMKNYSLELRSASPLGDGLFKLRSELVQLLSELRKYLVPFVHEARVDKLMKSAGEISDTPLLSGHIKTFLRFIVPYLSRGDQVLAGKQMNLLEVIVKTCISMTRKGRVRQDYSLTAVANFLSDFTWIPSKLYVNSPNEFVLQISGEFAQRFGVALSKKASIYSGWSDSVIDSVKRIVSSFVIFGREEWKRVSSSLADAIGTPSESKGIISAVDDIISKLKGRTLKMRRDGVIEPKYLVSPSTWLKEFISKPRTKFAQWLVQKALPDEKGFFALPQRLVELQKRVSHVYDRIFPLQKSKNLLDLMVNLPRLIFEYEIENDVSYEDSSHIDRVAGASAFIDVVESIGKKGALNPEIRDAVYDCMKYYTSVISNSPYVAEKAPFLRKALLGLPILKSRIDGNISGTSSECPIM